MADHECYNKLASPPFHPDERLPLVSQSTLHAPNLCLTTIRFVISFFVLTYFLNRPCVYCSILLLILFASSCSWSDHCFFDIHSNWFEPRHLSSAFTLPSLSTGESTCSGSSAAAGCSETGDESAASFLLGAMNSTAAALAGAAFEEAKRRIQFSGQQVANIEWTGIGLEWVRSLLGRREWTIPCVDVAIRL